MNYLRAVLIFIYVALLAMLMLTRCDRRDTVAPAPEPAPAPAPATDTVASGDQDLVERAENIGHDGKLKVTLLWDFPGDVDLHAHTPAGKHIYFQHKRDSSTGGRLDVDNIAGGRGSAENIYWENPKPGTYKIGVMYYNMNEAHPGGPVKIVIKQIVNGQEQAEVIDLNLSPENLRDEIIVKSVEVH